MGEVIASVVSLETIVLVAFPLHLDCPISIVQLALGRFVVTTSYPTTTMAIAIPYLLPSSPSNKIVWYSKDAIISSPLRLLCKANGPILQLPRPPSSLMDSLSTRMVILTYLREQVYICCFGTNQPLVLR